MWRIWIEREIFRNIEFSAVIVVDDVWFRENYFLLDSLLKSCNRDCARTIVAVTAITVTVVDVRVNN